MEAKRKPIRLSEHARQQIRFRGATDQEVFDSIRTQTWEIAELDRLEFGKIFYFNQNGIINIMIPNRFVLFLSKNTRK